VLHFSYLVFFSIMTYGSILMAELNHFFLEVITVSKQCLV